VVQSNENDDNSWFANFAQDIDLNSEECPKVRSKKSADDRDRKSSTRILKLIRCTAGKQTHLKNKNDDRENSSISEKSALTLYLEEKNAHYESLAIIALDRLNPPSLQPEDQLFIGHRNEIAAVKSAIRLRWLSEKNKPARKYYSKTDIAESTAVLHDIKSRLKSSVLASSVEYNLL
jgi:hypothetical protein